MSTSPSDTPTDPPGVQAAREALTKTEAPPRHVHSWRLVCNDHGHDVAGSSAETEPPHWATWSTRCEECEYNFDTDDGGREFTITHNEWDVAPDQTVDARHLRATLAHLDTLTARLAVVEGERDAARKRWMWTVATAPGGGAILSFRAPGQSGFAQVATALPRGDGMLSVRINRQAHTAADDMAAALATIRAVLGADVPDLPTEDSK